jgi:hypothetical protein
MNSKGIFCFREIFRVVYKWSDYSVWNGEAPDSSPGYPTKCVMGNIAQWLEQHPYTVSVKGSSPFISIIGELANMVYAPDRKSGYPGSLPGFSTINGQLPEWFKGVLCKRSVHKFESCTDLVIFLWCNGSTPDFGSEDRGSNPCRKTC